MKRRPLHDPQADRLGRHLAENPAVELLQSLGYAYVPPEALEPERASLKETVLTGRLAAVLKRLNPWLSEKNVAKAVKAVTQVPAARLAEANRTLYTSLTYGIALEQDRGGGRKSHTRPVPRLRATGAQRVDRHPPVPGARVEEARHPRRRRLRQRPAPRDHRMQEPHHRRRLEGRCGEAAPTLPGGRLALEVVDYWGVSAKLQDAVFFGRAEPARNSAKPARVTIA